MSRLLRILPLLLLFNVLGGCGFKDIDKRFFVVATGFDLSGNENKPYRITLQLAIPSPQVEPGSSKTQYETIDAPSIAEGIRMLKSYVDKELDFGHCKMFIIGESLARKDITLLVDWMLRRRDIQNVANIAVGRPNAASILHIQPKSERYPGNALLLSFGADGTESSYSYAESLSGLARRISEKGIDPILSIVTNHGDKSYIINQVAIFDKTKIKAVLTPPETQLFNQLTNHFTKASMHGMFGGAKLVVAINKLHSSFQVKNGKDTPLVTMKVSMEVVFEEAPTGIYDVDWKPIEKQLSEEYVKASTKLLKKIQQTDVDPFGFGLRYRADHPKQRNGNEWKSVFAQSQFDIKVDMEIKGTGLIK
ncbi:Ger(x)C family spore germination protein [Paenibacillus sp. GSMTC-2017]|uniref:Ger(x)C family spore germination protein n=1 Tax=Paenibacillus sp. GSMTC-2017 TaxID=2794350 RepID=UPI0018D9D23D|nr:Ger(x)C family spore germination protein [Paenibacillus sp. GSMTC-2017]MBH5317221.1 Ger(x)C family spore germination protein [Paenibacillus sp. GSMTC-2017]